MDKKLLKGLVESYNKSIQTACERSMHTVKTPGDLRVIIEGARETWESTEFRGSRPASHFSDLTMENGLADVFETAAAECDDFIPVCLAEKMVASADSSYIAGAAEGGYDIGIRTAAIRLMGMSGDISYVNNLIGFLYIEDEYGDLIKETTRRALVALGPAAVDALEGKLSSKDILSDDDFHIVIALINIDPGRKSDRIFRILKESFRKTSDKALAARCLSDYGYLEKNMGKLDENTIFEIQGAVLNLGGSTDGIGGS